MQRFTRYHLIIIGTCLERPQQWKVADKADCIHAFRAIHIRSYIFCIFLLKSIYRFDTGNWLIDKKGFFLLVPIIITEPAIGYDGGAALS